MCVVWHRKGEVYPAGDGHGHMSRRAASVLHAAVQVVYGEHNAPVQQGFLAVQPDPHAEGVLHQRDGLLLCDGDGERRRDNEGGGRGLIVVHSRSRMTIDLASLQCPDGAR